MKATLRKNGKRMFTFVVRHYVDRDDLVMLVAQDLYESGDKVIDKKPGRTRTSVLQGMRERLNYRGPWDDDAWENTADEERDAAGRIVDALFPELQTDEKDD